MVINDFVAAMQSKDHKGPRGVLHRGLPPRGLLPLHGEAAEHVPVRAQRHRDVRSTTSSCSEASPCATRAIVNERTVNFYADYNGTIIHALAQIENCNDGVCSLDDSLIKELVIRPA